MEDSIIFQKGEGGLGRGLPGFTHVSGLLCFRSVLPSGFSSTNRIQAIYSLSMAESLGIVGDSSDETRAVGKITIDSLGVTGDVLSASFTEPLGNVVSLGEYAQKSTDLVVDDLAIGYAGVINLGTPTHGYSATVATDEITITARRGLGVYPNTKSLVVVNGGTIDTTVTAFSGGVASQLKPLWYHISEFFRGNPNGVLWVSIQPIPGATPSYSEIVALKNAADNQIRQVLVFDDQSTFAVARVQALEVVAATCDDEDAPLQIILTPNIKGTALSALPNLRSLSCPSVAVDIAQDLGADGYETYHASGKSVGRGGKMLGDISLSTISQSIGATKVFFNNNGTELDKIGFSNGDAYKTTAKPLVKQLDNYGYSFMYKDSSQVGTFSNRWNVAVTASSDYAYGEDNRTIDELIRDVRTALFPFIQSTIIKTAQGLIDDMTISLWTNAVGEYLEDRVTRQDISAYKVLMDPAQDTTGGIVNIAVEIVKNDIAVQIIVPIKYSKSV